MHKKVGTKFFKGTISLACYINEEDFVYESYLLENKMRKIYLNSNSYN